MNWANGFSAKYTYAIVDASSWNDLEVYDLTGGSVMKSENGLMESADMIITDIPVEGEAWVRIYLNATSDSEGTREALFTGLLQVPATDWNGRMESHNAELYSVLKPAEDVHMTKGWYAPAGANGAAVAAELLSVSAAPVEYAENAPTLTSAIIAESNETNLTMAQKLVAAIGWRIRITGMGEIRILPKATETSAVLDPLENDIMELKIKDVRDWYSCPNVLRVTIGDMTATARDDDPDSPYSTVSRGREIWEDEFSASLNDGESIEEYTLRRLKELQSPARSVQYTRRYLPDVYPGDIISIRHPAQRIDDYFHITNQKITLSHGARTSEEVYG
ncbi:MAG: hypothetical protein IJJ48_07645 [Firmicutes bacterium]|nr:hypothetical protein [Bacillota bacterium]